MPEKVDEWTKGKKCVMALNSIGGRMLRLAKSICEENTSDFWCNGRESDSFSH